MAKRYGMVIDTKRCFGCQTCVVSCKVCHEIPEDLYWNRIEPLDGDVLYQATGTFPDVKMTFRAVLCNHCQEAECVKSCPTGAMQKDEETGVVSVNEELCIGCGTCTKSCPYSMPKLDTEKGVSTKCTFCIDRVGEGELPYCVESCPGRARFFGDLDDENNEVAQMILEQDASVWHEEYGTGPSVYYLQ